MTDDNSFKNNPFKALEKGRFPQQKKTGAPAAPEKTRQAHYTPGCRACGR